MTVEEAEVILRKLCPDLKVEVKPNTGVTILSGNLILSGRNRVTSQFIDVRCFGGKVASVLDQTGYNNGSNLRKVLEDRTRYMVDEKKIKNPCGTLGTILTATAYNHWFDKTIRKLEFRLRSTNWAIRSAAWSYEAITPEMLAMAAAVSRGDDSAVGGLVDYLIEYSPEFAAIWDEATEWAARVATGTVMRPLDHPSPVVKTAL